MAVIISDKNFWVCNVGDSRLVLMEKVDYKLGQTPVDPKDVSHKDLGIRFATTDQTPNTESDRIFKSGNTVTLFDNWILLQH